MKKFLILFVVLDFIFVGVVLKIFSENERSIASLEQENPLSDGKAQKLELIKSLKLITSNDEITLDTNLLQSLCASYEIVELKFKAINVAFSGQPPLISHTYSCSEVRKKPEQQALVTTVADFRSMKTQNLIKKPESQLKAFGLFSDEDLPAEWQLYEISVSGELSFTISEAEFNQVLGINFFKVLLATY